MPQKARITTPLAPLVFIVAAGLASLIGSGGGGGGTEGGEESPIVVNYGIGAPQTQLGQDPMSVDLAPMSKTNRMLALALAAPPAEGFYFPAGPDGAGDALPRISGTFDTLTSTYTEALNSKVWLDLPASAGGYQMSVTVAQMVLSGAPSAGGVLTAGEIVIAPRQSYLDLSGRIRLTFNASATPVCIGWDSEANGSYETEHCTTYADFVALWQTPDAGLPLPQPVQQAAAATYAGWAMFYAQIDFSVGGLQIIESNYGELQASDAATPAVSVTCSVYPPSGTAGNYSISWLDRNGSGSFDSGDDVRFTARDCWLKLEGETNTGAGQIIDGLFELRGYERNVGAAPTFLDLRITETLEVGGVVTPQDSILINGGFSLHAPGITTSSGEVGAYHFTTDNLEAAASVAAHSMTFYPDIGNLGYTTLKALVASTASPQDLGLCRNSGTSTLVFTEGPAPHATGLSEADQVMLTLANCDLGSAGNPKIMDGTLDLTLWGVTLGPTPDWSFVTNARLDLQAVTTRGSTRRLGEFGLAISYVLGHSYAVGYRPQSYTNSETLSGVLTAIENGRLAYQVGCFAVGYYTGTWNLSNYQLTPNSVVKTASKVFTIGMRQGEAFLFKADATGSYYPDVALAGMLSISAPECVALGVPTTGVTGGETRIEFDAWPADDGDTVTLRLYDQSNSLLKEAFASWTELLH